MSLLRLEKRDRASAKSSCSPSSESVPCSVVPLDRLSELPRLEGSVVECEEMLLATSMSRSALTGGRGCGGGNAAVGVFFFEALDHTLEGVV